MENLILQYSNAEISVESFEHPGLRRVKFIFCDDLPNKNGQAISVDDFDDIMKSAVGTPVKMRYFNEEAGSHLGSVPIGHIMNMMKTSDEGVNKLVADAVLYADDYPQEVEYLSKSYAEGKAPGVSWEITYKDSILERGANWLKGVITRAATFVKNPAYGDRTAILALASNQNISDDDLFKELHKLTADSSSPKNDQQGGNNRMEEELQKIREELEALKASNETAVAANAEKDEKISELESKITELQSSVEEKDTALAEYQKKETLASRLSQLAEAGITLPEDTDKRTAKETFYLSLSEEAFAAVKEELAEAIASAKKTDTKKGLASLQSRTPNIPKVSVASDNDVDYGSLAERFKSFSRTQDTQQSE